MKNKLHILTILFLLLMTVAVATPPNSVNITGEYNDIVLYSQNQNITINFTGEPHPDNEANYTVDTLDLEASKNSNETNTTIYNNVLTYGRNSTLFQTYYYDHPYNPAGGSKYYDHDLPDNNTVYSITLRYQGFSGTQANNVYIRQNYVNGTTVDTESQTIPRNSNRNFLLNYSEEPLDSIRVYYSPTGAGGDITDNWFYQNYSDPTLNVYTSDNLISRGVSEFKLSFETGENGSSELEYSTNGVDWTTTTNDTFVNENTFQLYYRFSLNGTYPEISNVEVTTKNTLDYTNTIYLYNGIYNYYLSEENSTVETVTYEVNKTYNESVNYLAGTYKWYVVSTDNNNETNTSLSSGEFTVCINNWVASYGVCTINNTQLKTYNDTASCSESYDVPSDNGTLTACEYVAPPTAEVVYKQETRYLAILGIVFIVLLFLWIYTRNTIFALFTFLDSVLLMFAMYEVTSEPYVLIAGTMLCMGVMLIAIVSAWKGDKD